MTVMDKVIEFQDRMINDMQDAQGRIIDMNKRAWEAAGNLPKLPAVNLPKASWMPEVEDAPKPEALVGNYFDFAGKLLAANREFAESVVGVWTAERPEADEDAKSEK